MEPVHLDYNTYKDVSSAQNSSSKIEMIQQIKRGRSYTTTIEGIAYLIGVDDDNELVIIE